MAGLGRDVPNDIAGIERGLAAAASAGENEEVDKLRVANMAVKRRLRLLRQNAVLRSNRVAVSVLATAAMALAIGTFADTVHAQQPLVVEGEVTAPVESVWNAFTLAELTKRFGSATR